MPEHASRFAGLYDQQNENRIADWGGDELFTRMPRRRAVDDAPAPRFRPALELVDAPEDRRRTPPGEEWSGRRDRRGARSAEAAMASAPSASASRSSRTPPPAGRRGVGAPQRAPDALARAWRRDRRRRMPTQPGAGTP